MNPKALELKGVDTFAYDLSKKESFKWLGKKIGPETKYLLLDPPREGAPGLEDFVEMCPKLEKIFYISCDQRTWVRDVSKLSADFHLTQVQPLDQFPHTPHLEILSVLERIKTQES